MMKPIEPQDEELTYQQLGEAYAATHFTYKSNKIVRELSHTNKLFRYPEHLVMKVVKLFHLNQFQLIFFSQILTEEYPCHQTESDIFFKVSRRLDDVELSERSLYLYLVVIGYAVKYYLNEGIIVYDLEVKKLVPEFSVVFQAWASKYSNKVLRTNPKRLNTFYIDLMKSDDQEDSNFKNYNEIVEELGYIGPAQFSDDEGMDLVVDISKMSEGKMSALYEDPIKELKD